MGTKIIISLSILALTTDVQSQFYDFFQSYQPFLPVQHTTERPDFIFYPQENHQKRTRGETNNNDRQINKEQERKPTYSQDSVNNRQTTKRRHSTTSSIFNLNLFTTPKPIKKVKSSNRRNFDTNTNPQSNENKSNGQNSGLITDFDNNRQFYDESVNNIGNDYYTTTKRYPTPGPNNTTTKRNYAATRPSYYTTRPSYATTRPSYATTRSSYATTRPSYATTRPSYVIPNNNYNTNRPDYDVNLYTTHIPGVKPANVDLSKPPITNKPPRLAVYPRPTDSSVIRFPEDPDESPTVYKGPDEDTMSYAEKRKYIELAEKMCDKYKSFNVKKVEAIPLVPSPEPVRVNVSVCPPSNVPLVVGGKVVTIQEFPHMALLGWTKLQGGYSWKCGGSLISEQYVLTASHCAYQVKDDSVVTGAPRVVQLGSGYLDDSGALVIKVLSVYRHPKYIQTRSYYDIALLKLVKPVTFSEVVKPACLGVPPGVGEPVIATGWGRTEFGGSQSLQLRSVSVPVWDMDECRQVLGTSRKLPNGPSRDSQMCAGEKQGGKDTCQGDSGGPAQIQDGCAWRIVAVTSVGRSCGAPNTPALYATLHIPFIAAQIFGANTPNSSNRNKDRHDSISVNNNRNLNNDNSTYNTNQYRETNRNQNSNTYSNRKDDTSAFNDDKNVYFNSNSKSDAEYNLNINKNKNNRGNINSNSNNNYYNNHKPDYENISPNTNLDSNHDTSRNNNEGDINSYSSDNSYRSNEDTYSYNKGRDDGVRNSNYGNEYIVQPTYTEAPKSNGERSWWQY